MMSKKNVTTYTTIDCDDYGNRCAISNDILILLLDRSLLHCCTLDENGIPHITPIMYYFEMNKCIIKFLIEKKSVKARNLRKNPYVSFTADSTHKTNPLMNTGIMINAIARFDDTSNEIETGYERLRRRYSSQMIPELVGTYTLKSDLLVRASIFKIVYWKGPFFQRFICKKRSPSYQTK